MLILAISEQQIQSKATGLDDESWRQTGEEKTSQTDAFQMDGPPWIRG